MNCLKRAISLPILLLLFGIALAEEVERGLVSYVLENFDVENVEDISAQEVLLTSVDYWVESGGGNVTARVTPQAFHGNSALALEYQNGGRAPAAGINTYVLQNILDGSSVHAWADEASHACFTYRHEVSSGYDTDLSWRLVLYDASDCREGCSDKENLEAWEYTGGQMMTDNSWHVVSIPLDSNEWRQFSGNGNNVMDLRKLKGWRLEFSSAMSNVKGTIVVDQLALDGDGSMIGAPFRAASWEEASEDGLTQTTFYRSELSEERTQEVIYNGHFYVNYTVEQMETW